MKKLYLAAFLLFNAGLLKAQQVDPFTGQKIRKQEPTQTKPANNSKEDKAKVQEKKAAQETPKVKVIENPKMRKPKEE